MARSAPRKEDLRSITDVRTLAALAHPLRYALLAHLMSMGPATASECAHDLAESPSNCSWHLRHLARFGLVERSGSADRRERPWRAVATGVTFDPVGDRDAAAGLDALAATVLEQEDRRARSFLATRGQLPREWRDAATLSEYSLLATADELEALTQEIDALVRPFIGLTRDDSPAGAEAVHVGIRAFPVGRRG